MPHNQRSLLFHEQALQLKTYSHFHYRIRCYRWYCRKQLQFFFEDNLSGHRKLAGEDYSYTDSVADGGQQSDEQTENDDNSQEESTGFDITQYAEQLRELSKKQTEINEQLDQYDEDIEKSEKKQKLLKEKIDSINDEIDVLNSYMTALELQINTNQRNIDKKQAEINKGIEDFKQRLRAMYIAGSDSYTTMLLESDSFYDILMRLELIKRVAHHDDTIIDNLIKLKTEYEDMQKTLDKQKAEYDAQYTQYTQQKDMLSQLYRSSTKTQQELKAKQKKLREQNEAYEAEREQFEGSLSGILKSSGSGGTARDNEVSATMALADVKLEELHKEINDRLDKGEKLGDTEPDYYFAYSVPGLTPHHQAWAHAGAHITLVLIFLRLTARLFTLHAVARS